MRRVFLAGQVTSIMGDGLALLAIPLLVLQMTRSPLLAALAAAARSAGYFVVGVPAGPLADRLDATRMVRAADAVRFVIFAVLGVLAWLHAVQVWIVLVLACASACASVFFDASLAILVQDLFPGERLLGANACIETASQLARVAGPAAAALLATLAGIGAALWADAATFLASLATVTMVAAGSGAARPARPGAARRGARARVVPPRLRARTGLPAGAASHPGADHPVHRHQPVPGRGLAAGVPGEGHLPAVGPSGQRGDRRGRRTGSRGRHHRAAGGAAPAAGGAGHRRCHGSGTGRRRDRPPLGAVLAGAGTAAFGGDPRPVFLICGIVLASAAVAAWSVSLRHQRDYGQAALRTVPAATARDD